TMSIDGTIRPALIDSEGVVFRTGLRSNEHDLPVISGLQLERFEAGDVLPQELKPLFEDLHELRNEEPDLFAAISELRIVRSGGRYETVLYPVSRAVPVRLPARARATQYESAFRAIEVLSQREDLQEVDEIDLRSGDLVYTMGSEG
ncbi:MAG: cell division protein FtsQ/DivIB, partial [bacterium]